MAACSGAGATSVQWQAAGGGYWDDASNWSSVPALPGAGDQVAIPSLAGGTVTYRLGSTAVDSFDIRSAFVLGGGSLSVASTSSFIGNVTMSGSSTVLGGRGDVSIGSGSTFTWQAGAQTGSGQTLISAGAAMNVIGSADLERTLANRGALTIHGSIWGEGSIDNQAGGTLTLNNAGTIYSGVHSVLSNAGTIVKTGAGTTSTIGGPSAVNGTFLNSGTVDARSGTLVISGFHVMNGGTYRTSGGTLAFGAGTHVLDTAATIATSGVFMDSNSAVLQGKGTLTIAEGATFTWGDGSQSGSGLTVISQGATLNVTGLANIGQRTLQNNGTMTVTGSLYNAHGTIDNAAGRTLELRDGGTFYEFSDGTLNNAGTILKTGAGTTSALVGTLNNTGTVDVQAGMLVLDTNQPNAGLIRLAADTVMQIGLHAHFVNQGTLAGDGTVIQGLYAIENQGTLAPGADRIGQLGIMGDLTEAAAGRLVIDLAGTTSFDALSVSGSASLDGVLQVRNAGYAVALGDSFRVLSYADHEGSFSGLSLVGFDPGVRFELEYRDTDVLLNVTAVPEPASWLLSLVGVGVIGLARRRCARS